MADGSGIQGVDRLVDTLDAAAHELAGLTDPEAGQLLSNRAETTAPRKSGFLADQHELIVDAGEMTIVNTAGYAAIVHAREPWLTTALDAMTEEITNSYADDVADIVDQITGA